MADSYEDDAPAEPPIAPPKKRSLFSAAAKQKLTEADAAVEFFSRAKELYPQRLAEEERKRQKKLVKLERKRSSASAELRETTPKESKKRRHSSQKDARDGYSSDSGAEREQDEDGQWNRRASSHSTPSSQRRKSQQFSPKSKSQASPTSLSARYNKDLKAGKQQSPEKGKAPKGYISLTDSDDEGGKTALPVRESANQPISLDENDDIKVIPGPARRRSPPSVDEDDLQLSEEEFPELIAAAKEREAQRLLQKEKAAKSFSERNHGPRRDDLDDIFDSGVETPVEDPVVEILITSKMEGTTQLRVIRKFSQPFKPVRLSWCDKQMTMDGQPWDQALKDEIFLTWKSHKLYDNTTCDSLGLTLNSSGKLFGDGIDQDGRLHMEAWTADALEFYKKRKAAKEKKDQGGSDDEAAAREAKKAAIPKIKLILKAKDMEDVKLTVKAATTVEKMISAFRSIRKLPETKHITIRMDGDELELSTTIGELELEDMDILEVHVR